MALNGFTALKMGDKGGREEVTYMREEIAKIGALPLFGKCNI